MQPSPNVNLGNLLLSLSDAMDLVSPLIVSHQQRTAFIAWEICKQANLTEEDIEHIFVAALLHDVGAISPEEKIDILKFEVENTEQHCKRGQLFLESVSWLKPAGKIVRHHHTPWHDWGKDRDSKNAFYSQILFLADYLERLIKRPKFILHQHESLVRKLSLMAGNQIHPEIFQHFVDTAQREEFWLDLTSPRLFSLLLHKGPYKRLKVEIADICKIAHLFRNIIDFRSRYTSTHSSGVATCAAVIARIFGFTKTEVDLIEIAGNFHDIGKLVVPNSILNKQGRLTKKDKTFIKQHPYHTFTILNTIGGLQHIAEWAAFHHEKLNGSGYPFHHEASRLSTQSRIITVADMFTAMAEDRPYRRGMPKEKLLGDLYRKGQQNVLDKQIVDILIENYKDILDTVHKEQNITKKYYENKFAPLQPG